jgi:hypothetical protein
LQQAISAGQPVHLIHPLPEEWTRPRNWQPLEKLALKSECGQAILVEIGGMDRERNFVTASLELPPRKRLPVPNELYSVSYIRAEQLPEARLGIHSPLRGEAHIIQPHEWGNIWLYGMEIWLTGWLTHEDFRRKASVLPTGSRTFQYSQTRTKNLAVPMAELKPLGALFERIRQWAAARASA